MSFVQQHQQQNNNNNNNNLYIQLIQLLDVNENGRLVLPFSGRLILIDRPFENNHENSDNEDQNETSVDDYNVESEFSSSMSDDYFLTDDENNDDNNEDNGSYISLSLPPSPFAYDPFDSYDWES